jgi:hypothetical protein
MKSTARTLAIALLLFNGLTACFGGWLLMTRPDGSSLGMTVNILQYSPFSNFLIPGIVLFVANGLFSFIVAWLAIRNHPYALKLIILQGGILVGWIIVQMIMLREINYLHVIYGAAGMLLMACGFMLLKKDVVT